MCRPQGLHTTLCLYLIGKEEMYERVVRQINEALKRKRQRELLERFANGYKPEMKDTWKPTPIKKKHPPRPDLSHAERALRSEVASMVTVHHHELGRVSRETRYHAHRNRDELFERYKKKGLSGHRINEIIRGN